MNTKFVIFHVFNILFASSPGYGFNPEFTDLLPNITVAVSRDATFQCFVRHLGGYKVGWVKADTKAIQAIHERVVTHNPRISVTHIDHGTWNLHIRNVQVEDKGQYMCQINTDPMLSQMGNLNVVVPPDFIDEETSSDIEVPEGGTARLACRAKGHPGSKISWRREDGGNIVIREPNGVRNKMQTFTGEMLFLPKITRTDMGVYLCIASNGIPPSISKRIRVTVNFHPVINVPNQLVGAPLGTDVTLECNVEASPKSINYWVNDKNNMLISDDKHYPHEHVLSVFEVRMTVLIRNMTLSDIGKYKCLAKNSLGEAESVVRLYDLDQTDKAGNASKHTKKPGPEENGENEFSNSVLSHGTLAMKKGPHSRLTYKRINENHVPADPVPTSSFNYYIKDFGLFKILFPFVVILQFYYTI